MKITVVGLGKIGLPLAVQYASRGQLVIGADIDVSVVERVNAGVEPFPGERGLAESLSVQVGEGRLTATVDTAGAVRRSDAVVIVVPLFVDATGAPDFGSMDAATQAVARGLQPGTLVIYETTLPVGTTRSRWKPMLEEVSGLTEGEGFDLVFSPERVLTGRVFEDLRRYPKLVGGLSEQGCRRAARFYDEVLEFDERQDLPAPNGVWDLGTAEAAELAKLAETTYRDVNIGLANQFAVFAADNGIDIYKVIEACNSQPYSHIHQPGIAVGGHCIPVYPRLYLWKDPAASVVASARSANEAMPAHAVDLARRAYGDLSGARVGILGVTYRGGVKETAFSGAFPLARELKESRAIVSASDPMYSDEELRALGFEPMRASDQLDVVFVQADHPEYRALPLLALHGAKLVVDGRNVLDRSSLPGVEVVAIGEGSGSSAPSDLR